MSIDYIPWDLNNNLTPQTANTFLNRIAVFLFFGVRHTDETLSPVMRPFSPAENKPLRCSQQSHLLNGEHIPLKDTYVPVSRRQTQRRNLVSPLRPPTPTESKLVRCSQQSHLLNGEHIPLKDTMFPFLGVRHTDETMSLQWDRSALLRINCCPRQRAFGRLNWRTENTLDLHRLQAGPLNYNLLTYAVTCTFLRRVPRSS